MGAGALLNACISRWLSVSARRARQQRSGRERAFFQLGVVRTESQLVFAIKMRHVYPVNIAFEE